jgi:IS30 family transposase
MTPRRVPLSPLSANIERNRQLNPTERAYIQRVYEGDKKPTEIARLLNRPRQTIYTMLRLSTPDKVDTVTKFYTKYALFKIKKFTVKDRKMS